MNFYTLLTNLLKYYQLFLKLTLLTKVFMDFIGTSH